MKDSSWKVLLSLLLCVVFSLWMAAPLFSLTLSSLCAAALLAPALYLLHAASHGPCLFFFLIYIHLICNGGLSMVSLSNNFLKTHYNPCQVEISNRSNLSVHFHILDRKCRKRHFSFLFLLPTVLLRTENNVGYDKITRGKLQQIAYQRL